MLIMKLMICTFIYAVYNRFISLNACTRVTRMVEVSKQIL